VFNDGLISVSGNPHVCNLSVIVYSNLIVNIEIFPHFKVDVIAKTPNCVTFIIDLPGFPITTENLNVFFLNMIL
jgi:hypothetical protein